MAGLRRLLHRRRSGSEAETPPPFLSNPSSLAADDGRTAPERGMQKSARLVVSQDVHGELAAGSGRSIAAPACRAAQGRGAANSSSRRATRPIRPRPARPAAPVPGSLSYSRRRSGGDRKGDDARVRSRSPTAGADLRFARPAGDVATFDINGSRSSAVRVSSERHRRRLGRSLLAQPISAPDGANSLPEAGGAYARGPRPQSVTAVPLLATSASLSVAAGLSCVPVRAGLRGDALAWVPRLSPGCG